MMLVVCVEDCDAKSKKALLKVSGGDREAMQRVNWNVQSFRGKSLVIRIVDRSKANWGHVTFDDLSMDAELTR